MASRLGSTIAGHASLFKYRFDLDMLAERPLQQLCGVDDQRIDVGFPGLERLLAGERQQMLGKVRAARCGFVDHPRDGGELRLALHRIGEDFDRSGDDGKDVVEVMGDAAGELADRFHLFGLPDPVLGRDLVGEIAHESVEHKSVAAPQFGNAQFDLDLLAVAPQRVDLDAAAENGAFSGAQEALDA